MLCVARLLEIVDAGLGQNPFDCLLDVHYCLSFELPIANPTTTPMSMMIAPAMANPISHLSTNLSNDP